MSRNALAVLLAVAGLWLACSPPPTSDVPAPTIKLQEPQEGSVLTEDTVVLSGTIASPQTPLSSAEYQVQDGAWAPLPVNGDGSFSATVPAPLAAGMTISLKVRATNEADKRAEESVEVLVQNAHPTIEISAPKDGAVIGPASIDSVTFTGTAVDQVTGAPATLTLDFQDGQGPRAVDNGASGFSITVPLAEEDFVAHDVQLLATDARGNTSTQTLRLYVDRVAPSVEITSPNEGQKLARADFPSGGDVVGTFTRTDGDPATLAEMDLGNGWLPVAGDTFRVATSESDDGVDYTVRLRLTDTAGNATIVSRVFGVDRVAPTATFDRQDGARLTPPSVQVTFSEPVTTPGAPFTLTPEDGTASSPLPFAGVTWSVEGLAGDTVYTATPGAFADAFGNPGVVGAPLKFHTRPAQPARGAVQTLRTDVVAFDVSSDPDGRVALMMETSAGSKPMVFAWFSGADGALTSGLLSSRPSGTLLQLGTESWSTPRADLSTLRTVGFRKVYSGGSGSGGYHDGNLVPGTSIDAAFVPVAPGCGDDAAAPDFGFVTTGGAFVRGSTVEPVAISPERLLLQSPDDWELVGTASGALKAQARTCTCGAQSSCAWQPARTLPLPNGATLSTTPRLSVTGTAAGTRRLYVVDTSAGLRVERCEASCSSGTCPSDASQSGSGSEGLFVASAHSGNAVIGARKAGTGVQLVRRDLESSCTGGWTVLGTAPGSSGSSVTQWRPAMFGEHPGLIWLDGTTLRLYIP